MWHHAFESQGEVNRFTSPASENFSHLSWQASGGPGGFPFMRIRIPAGRGAAGNVWVRPMAALPALAFGSLSELPSYSAPADPGYTHSVAGGAEQWDRTNSTYYRNKTVYGHPDYWPGGAKYAEWQANGGGTADLNWFAGHDFWLSVAFRCSSTRWQPSLGTGGKAMWFFYHRKSYGGTEVPFREYENSGGLWCYQAGGYGDLLLQEQGNPYSGTNSAAYGSEWQKTCLVGNGWYQPNSSTVNNCWHLPSWPGNVGDFAPYTPETADETTWTHLLFYWKLGQRSATYSPPFDPSSKDTTLKVWTASNGSWRPLFMFTDRAKTYDTDAGLPYGFSVFSCSGYHNGVVSPLDWWRDFGQIIFKRGDGRSDDPAVDGIPPPAVA